MAFAAAVPPAQPRAAVAGVGEVITRWGYLLDDFEWDLWEAAAVVLCESSGDPNAYNPSTATGLFQVLGGSFDPETNARQAISKYRDGVSRGNRWAHWNCCGACGHFY